MKYFLTRTVAVGSLLVATGGFVAASVPAAAAEKDPAGRITTTIGTWFGTVTGGVVYLESSAGTTLFTVPEPGTSGPIEYPDGDGGSLCLSTSQDEPYSRLRWRPAALDPCQDVTTVVDPVSGSVGFMATDGPYAGRYLGDRSLGGMVDWDLQTFYGTDVPAITPRVPVPVDDARSTVEGQPVTIDVLGNDGDTTGWTVSAGTPPGNGTVVVNPDGTATYTPNNGFLGDDSFTYAVTDGNGAKATATVTVTVNAAPIAPLPLPVNDAGSTPAGQSITLDVLGNDGDTTGWTVSAGTAPGHGTVAVNADGTIAYTPDIGYVGDDSFTYTVTDGNGATGTATVTITVTPVVAPPAEGLPAPSVPATPEPKPNSQSTSAPAALADTGTKQVAPMLGLVGILIAAGSGLTLVNRRKNA